MADFVKKNFPVEGMGCAACVARVENTLKRQNGVKNVSVSLASNMAQVEYDPAQVNASILKRAVEEAGYSLLVDESAEAEDEADRRRLQAWQILRLDCVTASVIALAVMLLSMLVIPSVARNISIALLAAVSVFWCGRRFISVAWKQAVHGSANMDTLVALSTIISFTFSLFNMLFPSVWTSRGLEAHLYFESCSMIVAFILLGRLLEERAKRRTTASVRALIGLQPKDVFFRPGELVTVKPGERIPVDGEVISGESFVDESMLSGEPVPAGKYSGSSVYAGTINGNGVLTVRALKVGSDTMLSSIIRMVRDAQGSKAGIQVAVDKVASVFVPVIIAVSLLTLICWILLAPGDGFTMGLLSMVTVLVIACPCSLGLATPTALIAGIGTGASKGILIKDADALQAASGINAIVLDKTGTITTGHPEVVGSWWADESLAPVLLAMERLSSHPLAEAVFSALSKSCNGGALSVSSFTSMPGRGVSAVYEGISYVAENSVPEGMIIPDQVQALSGNGATMVYFHDSGRLIAALAIKDTVKEGASYAISRLAGMGIETWMLTGDNEDAARSVASESGIRNVRAGVLPADKLQFIKELQDSGKQVAMVGDGINDSAALAGADVSIAMGSGSDIAIDAAMVTIVSSNLERIPDLISLSSRTVKIIRQNLFWAFFYNLLAVPVAAGILYPINGFLLNPMIAAACMALSSLCVVSNSLRLRNK